MKEIKQIVALWDSSEIARRVIDFAASQAKANSAKLVVLHVEPESAEKLYHKIDQEERDRRARLLWQEHKNLAEIANELRERGVAVQPLLVEGPELEVILKELEKLDPDLLVIGHHHHSAWYKLFHDSIGEELVNQVRCPVTLIS